MIKTPFANRGFFAGIFFIGFLWICFLTQGFPVGDPDDWDHLLAAREIPWKDLLRNLFTPWSTSQFWHGQADRINEVLSRRVFLTAFLKSIGAFAGLNSFPYYVFSEALIFAGVLCLLFVVLRKITNNLSFSCSGLVFYALVPAHYPHLLWLTDPAVIVHFLLLAAFLFFLDLIQNWENPQARFFPSFAGMALAGALAMKTKEPAFIFPLMAGSFVLLNARKLAKNPRKFFTVLMALTWLAFLLVPVTHFHGQKATGYGYHPGTVVKMLFRNYGCGYEDEKKTAFFSLEHVWPVSIARTFGFGFLWLLAAAAFVRAAKCAFRIKTTAYFNHPAVALALLWAFFDILFMGYFQNDPRYFSGTMIPLTLLSVRLSQWFYENTLQKIKRPLGAGLILLLALSSVSHLQSILYLRMQVGIRVNRFLNVSKIIYEDFKQRPPTDTYDLASFYSTSFSSAPPEQRMENHTYYLPMGYEKWNRAANFSAEEFKAAAAKGFLYYAAYAHQWQPQGPEFRELGTVDGINHQSLAEELFYRVRPHPDPIKVYKCIAHPDQLKSGAS